MDKNLFTHWDYHQINTEMHDDVDKVHNFLTWMKVQVLLVKYYSIT